MCERLPFHSTLFISLGVHKQLLTYVSAGGNAVNYIHLTDFIVNMDWNEVVVLIFLDLSVFTKKSREYTVKKAFFV